MHVDRSDRLPAFQDLYLARLGSLAPSQHNTQPWKFSAEGNVIRVYPDFTRRLRATDPKNVGIYISLGCITENIVLAAAYYGISAEIEYSGCPDAAVVIRLMTGSHNHSKTELIAVISLRQCVRRPFDNARIAGIHLQELLSASRQTGVEFRLIDDEHRISRTADVLHSGGSGTLSTSPVLAELISWTRFNRREADSRRDGLLFTEMGYPPMPRCIGRRLIAALVRANRQAEESASLVRSSAALIVFAPHQDDRIHWFNVGRSFERVVLSAASLKIRYAHLQLPYASHSHNGDLRSCFGLQDGQEFLAARIGYSDLVLPSLRRPISQMLSGSSHYIRLGADGADGSVPLSSSRGAQP